MNSNQPYTPPNGKRFRHSITELQRQNIFLAQGILDHLDWRGNPSKLMDLLQPTTEEVMSSQSYFTALQAENDRLRKHYQDLLGDEKSNKTLTTLIRPGHEHFIAPYNLQLKKKHGRMLSSAGIHLDPHHIMYGWQGKAYQQNGKIKGPEKYRVSSAPTVLTDADIHAFIHRASSDLPFYPWDALQADLDRFEEVHNTAGTPGNIVTSVRRALETEHARRYDIQKPKEKREGRIAMRIGGDRPEIVGRR